EQGNEAIADMKFYLEMPSAKEWYQSIRNNYDNGIDQEYSYGFRVEEASQGQHEGKTARLIRKQKVYEVSPVLVGAGVNTRTLGVKEEKDERPDEDEVPDDFIRDQILPELTKALDAKVGGEKLAAIVTETIASLIETKKAVAPHSTKTTDAAWDAAAVRKRV